MYVGSLAVRMTTTGDGGGWTRRRAECSRRDIVQASINEHSQLEIVLHHSVALTNIAAQLLCRFAGVCRVLCVIVLHAL